MPFKRNRLFHSFVRSHSDDSIRSFVSCYRCESMVFLKSQHPIHTVEQSDVKLYMVFVMREYHIEKLIFDTEKKNVNKKKMIKFVFSLYIYMLYLLLKIEIHSKQLNFISFIVNIYFI